MVENVLQGRFWQNHKVVVHAVVVSFAESLRPHLQLMATFLTAYVQYAFAVHSQYGLKHQCTLTDTWFTAQQGYGASHQASAQNSVQFCVTHVYAWLFLRRYLVQLHRPCFLCS